MVIDVTESSFAHDVLERSLTTPVVVDFWAEWCAPCRALGPVLEQVVEAHPGDVVLAKVDVDANPGLQARFGVRGIPAVKAFRGGQVVSEFVGAQPRPAVERFVEALLPSPAERLTEAGDEASLRRAIDLDPGLAAPRVALARMLLDRGDADAAAEVLAPAEHDPVAAGLIARVQLASDPAPGAPAIAALDALRAGDPSTALPALVETVRSSGGGPVRDLARRVAVGLFNELGDAHPLTQTHRPQLAAALH
ncbi:MAG TPA: tetratricopeptide repeat protein [Candidatus Dormibacteraeota bacterium]